MNGMTFHDGSRGMSRHSVIGGRWIVEGIMLALDRGEGI